MSKKVIGYDIGGTKCAVILGEIGGKVPRILDKIQFPTEADKSHEITLLNFKRFTERIFKDNYLSPKDIDCIGISCGGPLDSKRGVILSPPNLPDWDGVPIVRHFRDIFGVPVKVQNDANACALAEWKYGAGRGCGSMIFLTFGTGLGAGLILDGRLYVGANDMAGEVGHIRLEDDGPEAYGKKGSFEGFCSGAGISRLTEIIAEREIEKGNIPLFCTSEEGINPKTVAEAALKGDETAIEIYKTCGEHLGKGLAILIDILNPERIVIGSVFARQRDLIWRYCEPVLRREALSYSLNVCEVVPAALGENVGDIAALAVADM